MWLKYLWYVLKALWRHEEVMSYSEWLDEEDYLAWLEEDDEADQGWLCQCGHWQNDGLHCDLCGCEPPWGCDCSFCNDRRNERYAGDSEDDYYPV